MQLVKPFFLVCFSSLEVDYIVNKAKKICVFPIAWSSKLGSVGRDFFIWPYQKSKEAQKYFGFVYKD
jgi:hypothetical protein